MKMIKPTFHMLSFVWLATAVSGCAMGSANISNGKYTSPLGNFSLPIPKSMLGTKLDESNDNLGGYVSFHGYGGGLDAINYQHIPTDFAETFDDPVRRDHAYSSYLHDVLLRDWVRQISANAKILHEEFLDQNDGRELFAVVDVPEGSPLVDGFSGKRYDSTRALLIFETAGFMYALHYEIRRTLQQGDTFSLDNNTLERGRDSLHRFKETIEFR